MRQRAGGGAAPARRAGAPAASERRGPAVATDAGGELGKDLHLIM